ncbi:MAG TPA: sigma 54-interacting transcriptional regulator [Gammaproteobacteria bacterium]|nr:sigma 54-interacting transcriptional regulator [Gammaproteobacteria bacterium]
MQQAVASSSSEILRVLVEGTGTATGEEFFRSLARHAAQALHVKYAFAAESLVAEKPSDMESRSLAYWEGSDFGEGFSYRFPGTPCQRVAAGYVCSVATGLQALYPKDLWLQQIGADSYLGVPMKNAAGKVLGHIAVLHTEPMQFSSEDIAMLKIFAARACAELERTQAERALREALAQVERLKERLQAEKVYLQEELHAEYNFEEIVGNDPALLDLLETIPRVAASDAAVLIQGETGTGKELIARALHNYSPRRDRALVKVNCGAISAGLVESELFGHVKGAFTGALTRRVGRFELADGGTIFLDEVGELPAETQVKLLRVLQEQEFEPVGSNTTVRVDVRVIAATNRNLEKAVMAGDFRADLYYRLNVIPLRVPPLRERRGDIPQLAMFFLERSARKFGSRVRGIASETLQLLREYHWPGNIRELQNLIERAVILSPGPVLSLDPHALFPTSDPAPVKRDSLNSIQPQTAVPSSSNDGSDLPSLEEMERRHILAVLAQTRWIIEGPEGAAQILKLNPSTLRSRMKKLAISRSTTN